MKDFPGSVANYSRRVESPGKEDFTSAARPEYGKPCQHTVLENMPMIKWMPLGESKAWFILFAIKGRNGYVYVGSKWILCGNYKVNGSISVDIG